mgnify:CR=1 FL=1
MSLILEALKKSEAQRRLGQAPGLLSPAVPLAAPDSSRLPWLVALLAALLLGVFGFVNLWIAVLADVGTSIVVTLTRSGAVDRTRSPLVGGVTWSSAP